MKLHALILLVAMGVMGCAPSHTAYIQVPGPSELDGGGEDQKPVFADVLQVFQNNRCLNCHNSTTARGGVNLDNYETAFPHAAQVQAAIESGRMPVGGPEVGEKDRATIAAWVARGAPELEEPIVEPALNFETVNARIFTPMCSRCHGEFTTHANVVANLASIQAEVESGRMPRGGPLSDELKELLSTWIQKGAPL